MELNQNSQDVGEILYPLALLMDELKHDDVANRVLAMKRLDTIAIALGPERARNELLPFLFEIAHDDEDEVFAVLAEQLDALFIPLIGGAQYATFLLPTLEFLAAIEEPVVRDKAIASLGSVADHLSLKQLTSEFLMVLNNLATADWFLLRVLCCGLFHSAVARVEPSTRKRLLMLFLNLVKDDAPMVRRAAGAALPGVIQALEVLEKKERPLAPEMYALAEGTSQADWALIFQMLGALANDGQDSVKLYSTDVLIAILAHFNSTKHDDSHNARLLEDFLKLANDESWRVRYSVAEKFAEVVQYFAPLELNGRVLTKFLALLKDQEAEVRKLVLKQIPAFAKLIEPSNVVSKMVPQVEELITDQNELVRAALALKIAGLAPILGEQATSEHLLSVFLEMLNDDFPEVRLNIILNLTTVSLVIGINLLLKALLPAITELAKDKQWRVRLAIIEYIPLLLEQLGLEFFNKVLVSLCMLWLWDLVYTIREAAVLNLKRLAQVFGDSWAKSEIVDKIVSNDILADYKRENPELFEGEGLNIENVNNLIMNNFIYRITCLFTLVALVDVVQDDKIISEDIVGFLEHLAQDSVPNIRFNVAKGLKKVTFRLLRLEKVAQEGAMEQDGDEDELAEVRELKQGRWELKLAEEDKARVAGIIKEKIQPVLTQLTEDLDMDVQFFARKSLEEVKLGLQVVE